MRGTPTMCAVFWMVGCTLMRQRTSEKLSHARANDLLVCTHVTQGAFVNKPAATAMRHWPCVVAPSAARVEAMPAMRIATS